MMLRGRADRARGVARSLFARPLIAVVTTCLSLAVTPGTAFSYGDALHSQAPHPSSPSPSPQVQVQRLCSRPTQPGVMACDALVRTDAFARWQPSRTARPPGYGPSDLRSAYNLPSSGGFGATVAVVDAYDDPHAEADLSTYRAQYGLRPCTTANGCFRKLNQHGSTSPLPSADPGWAGEISLDLDMVSAVCPSCKITLLEADSDDVSDLGTAVNTAVSLGAKYVSNSYGGPEYSSEATDDTQYFNHPGVTVTFSAGDSGYGVQYPAASKYVTAVGGTSLTRSSTARGWSESVWGSARGGDGTGSGCSAYESKPRWQTDSGCSRRTVADVSAVADPTTGVAVYDTYQAPGWQVYGGTSAAAPLIAGVYALAGTPASNTYPASYPYAHRSSFHDVSTGADGTCAPAYLCTGEPGYDGPTGLGTPNGSTAFSWYTRTGRRRSADADGAAGQSTAG
jgi:Subtilase family